MKRVIALHSVSGAQIDSQSVRESGRLKMVEYEFVCPTCGKIIISVFPNISMICQKDHERPVRRYHANFNLSNLPGKLGGKTK